MTDQPALCVCSLIRMYFFLSVFDKIWSEAKNQIVSKMFYREQQRTD